MPTEMHNPARPGHALQEYMEGMNITHVAKQITNPINDDGVRQAG
jgi:hypothetical protein